MKMVRSEDLVYEYVKRDEEGNVTGTHRAIDHVDIDAEEGQFIAVLGHNGSGKSTFLNARRFGGQEVLPGAPGPKTAVLTRLEYAMKRLGLVVIRPQRGDTFQNDVHTLTTTSSETINVPEFAKIDQCITPGVLAERADLRFREVIVPAVVTLMVD